MNTEPRIEQRDERPYAGIRTDVPWDELPKTIPGLIGEVAGWLGAHGGAPSGAPLIRYHVINMEHSLDIEVGWPVSTPVTGAGRVSASVLPAGRYATLIHIGPYDQLRDSNAALIDWIHSSGLAIEQWPDPKGDAFGARYEAYLTNPDEQPDPSKWETEIAIKLAD